MMFKYLYTQKRIGLCILAVGIAAVSGTLFFTLKPTPTAHEAEIPVVEDAFSTQLVLLGRIGPYQVVSLYAPFEGTVQSLTVNSGDPVNANDPLLTLSTRKLDTQLREALAEKLEAQKKLNELIHWDKSSEMLAAQRNITQLERELGRIRRQENESSNLFLQGIIPRQELDELSLQRQTQETGLKEALEDRHQLSTQAYGENRKIAEMALLNATEKYDDLLTLQAKQKITAPFNGTVFLTAKQSQETDTSTTIETGAQVSAGQQLMQMASSERFTITSFVLEHDLHQLQTGQPVTVTGDGFNQKTLHGHIESISQHAESADDLTEPARFAITIALDDIPTDTRPYIRSGMLVTITINT